MKLENGIGRIVAQPSKLTKKKKSLNCKFNMHKVCKPHLDKVVEKTENDCETKTKLQASESEHTRPSFLL